MIDGWIERVVIRVPSRLLLEHALRMASSPLWIREDVGYHLLERHCYHHHHRCFFITHTKLAPAAHSPPMPRAEMNRKRINHHRENDAAHAAVAQL